jgi:hypothetical protein
MKMLLMLVCSIWFLGCSSNQVAAKDNPEASAGNTPDRVVAEGNVDPFTGIQPQFFPMLDFRAGPEHLKAIPEFAARLSSLADGERTKLKSGILTTDSERSRAGLIFIYDALMTINNTNGVTSGFIQLADLKVARRFSAPGMDKKHQLEARMKYALGELKTAATLRPDDRRIDSWIAASNTGLITIKEGKPSDKVLTASLDAIGIRPSFNLWTSIILFRNQDAGTEFFDRLVAESKMFVDNMQKGVNPCKEKPQDCNNGAKAPYNTQASIAMLGDVFLRQAEYFLSRGNIPSAMEMAAYAKGTYDSLNNPQNAENTKSWPDNQVLVERSTYIGTLKPGASIEAGSFQKTAAYQRVYDCASCHGRATAPNPYSFQPSAWNFGKPLFENFYSKKLALKDE